jgi:hypothetical protein
MDFGQDPGLVGGPAPAAAGRRAQAEVPTVALPAFNGRPDEAPGEEWLGSNGDPRPLGAAPLGAPTPLDAFGSAAARPGRRPATRLGRASHAAADPVSPVNPVSPANPMAPAGLMAPADPMSPADPGAEASPAKEPKSRRRMGWRKGSDIDEEMWPTEAFGGLSDDQFWDDLASDKPLTTTARTAHQDSGAKHRPPDAVVPADRARGNGRRAAHEAGSAPGYPDTRPRPAVQPAPQAPLAQQSPPPPHATQPQQAPQPQQGTQPQQAPQLKQATQLHQAPQPVPSLGGGQTDPGSARQFSPGSSEPMRAATGPNETRGNETRGRRHADAGEDPLTSEAFSLRASGPVDGRSNQAHSGPREASWDQYNAAVSQETETQAFRTVDTQRSGAGWSREGGADAYSGTSAYLYPGRPSGERRPYGESRPYNGNRSRSEPVTDVAAVPSANTTPYSDPYGNAPADEPRRQNGAVARRGTQPPRPGYQGPALPGDGHRRPRDPRDEYHRLVTKRL